MEQKMIMLKKAIKDKEGDTIGFEIVEGTEFLVEQQLNKPKEKRSKPWKHVEVATQEDIKQYGSVAQQSRKKESVILSFDEGQINEIKKVAEEATQYAESILKENEATKQENEELKKKLADLEKANMGNVETKKESKKEVK